MNNKILYLGDTKLDSHAAYLAGVMDYYGIDFDYVPSDKKPENKLLEKDYSAVVLSDYPSENFRPGQSEHLSDNVKNGQGLLMIGGWESFTGLEGNYNNTKLKKVLPVLMSDTDDRVNHFAPCLIGKNCEHEIIEELPFEQYVPSVGGFNSLSAKQGAKVILSVQKYLVEKYKDQFCFSASQSYPLLITGTYGQGRTAAFASDVAPHWVGGFVDWGNKRINAHCKSSNEIEVGNWYAEFFRNLVFWVSKSVN